MSTTMHSAVTVLLSVHWFKGVKEARYAAITLSELIAGKWRQAGFWAFCLFIHT